MEKSSPKYYDWLSEKLYSAILADTMDGLGYQRQIMRDDIRPLYPDARVVGRAATMITVDVVRPPVVPLEKQLMLLDDLKPGDVIVCASQASRRAAMWGELLSTCARARGARGAIVDGLSRDAWATNAMPFPVFAIGLSPASSIGRMDTVSIRGPVEAGGVLVNDGDLVFADYDGCVVVPSAIEDEVVRVAMEKVSSENTVRDLLADGASILAVFKEHGTI